MKRSARYLASGMLLCAVMVSGLALTAEPVQTPPPKAAPAEAVHEHDGPPPLTAEETAKAASDYKQYCALCHGPDREGYVNDHAPSLRSKSLLSSDFPAAVYNAIAYGRPGTPMGGYMDDVGGPLDQKAILGLMRWLNEVEDVPMGGDGIELVVGDAGRGAPLYAEHCASCHGDKGQGGTGTALANQAMLALTPDGFLREAIAMGRAGTPMQAWAGKLEAEQIDDVVAFLRSRASGWTSTAKPVAPPRLEDLVLNPEGIAPEFPIKGDHYIVASDLDRVLKEKRRFVLLDTRVPSVWQMGHIAGAAPIPYYSSRESLVAALPNDGTWIVAYCECPRAAADSLYRKLKEAKFANVAVLWEGIGGWVSLGYPVARGAGVAETGKGK